MPPSDDDIYAVKASESVEVPYVTQKVIHELRAMAAGGDGYERFAFVSPHIKRIWIAAALLIEAYQASLPR